MIGKFGRPQKSKPKAPKALMIVMGGEPDEDETENESGEPDEDDQPEGKPSMPMGKAPMGKAPVAPGKSPAPGKQSSGPAPGESLFHGQEESCANCSYFNGSICTMKVPEADFSINDPNSSWCKFWEGEKNVQSPDGDADDQQVRA